jgi:hypothetical protein
MFYIKVAFLLIRFNHRIKGGVVILWFYCSFVTWSRWVFAYSTRGFSFESWLLLLMNGGLLKQRIDALIFHKLYYRPNSWINSIYLLISV